MGWISRKTDKGSYVARYRDPAGREHSKSFRTRAEGQSVSEHRGERQAAR